MGLASGVMKWLDAPVRCLQRGVRAHLLGAALVAGIGAVAPAQDAVELTLTADVTAGGPARPALPQRVIFVVDGSGSMYHEDSGVERWSAVAAQLRSDLQALAAGGVPIELTVVKFGDRPSSVEAPGANGWSGTLAGSANVSQVASDVIYRLGQPSGTTALFLSMQDAVRALDGDLSSGRYSGGQVIIYSDGADSSKTTMFSQYGKLRSESIDAVRGLRSRHPLSNVILRTFGEDARSVAKELPDVVDLTGSALPVPPRVTHLSFAPSAVQMAPLRDARSQRITVKAQGLGQNLKDAVEVSLLVGGRRVRAEPTPQGWTAELELPKSERGMDIDVLARATGVPDARGVVRAAALVLPSSPSEWGLPRCGSKWGLSSGVGETVPLSVRVPDGVAVEWRSADGSWRATGATVTHPEFRSAGTYPIVVEVRTADGSKSESLEIKVIDPTIRIEGPASGTVGQPLRFSAAAASGAFASGARPGDVKWLVDGRPAASGSEFSATLTQRGQAMITAEVAVAACGTQVLARGSAMVSVAPVPSVELGDADVVRGAGALNSIPVRVMVASRVGAVRLAFNGGSEVRAVISQTSGSDDATLKVPLPPEAVARTGELAVTATPEVKSDDGSVDDAASARAKASRRYTVREPSPRVMIDEPAVGREATFESELPIKLHVEGSDADVAAVQSVRLTFDSERSQDVPIGSDRRAAAAVTPRFGTGASSLSIQAVAIDRAGNPVGAAQDRAVPLRQPKLELKSSVDQVHRDSKAPADLTITLASPDGAAGWDAGILSTSWSVAPPGSASIASESKSRLVLQVGGVSEVEVSATVRRGRVDEMVGPIRVPVVVDPIVPDYRVTELNSTRQVGTVIGERMLRVSDRTKGAVASQQFFLRRQGGTWEQISPESFRLAAAAEAGERIEVRGSFTSLDGTVVEGEPVQFLASPGHNWAIVSVVALCCLGLLGGAWWLCFNNEFLGAVVTWSKDPEGHLEPRKVKVGLYWPAWLRRRGDPASCSVVTKRVRIRLPMASDDEFGSYAWVRDLARRNVCVEMGGNLAAPQLTVGCGVGISPFGPNDLSRKSTLQPTAPGAEPMTLHISPSATAAFIGWMSFTASATAVLAVFAFLFFRGYI